MMSGGAKIAGQAEAEITRVGRWMSEAEYKKMLETGKVQLESRTQVSFVSTPPSLNSFLGAKQGSVFVEFDVNTSFLRQGGKEDWRRLIGPGSSDDIIGRKLGRPAILDIPGAANIKLVGRK